MAEFPLDYASATRGRSRWQVVLLILAAVAVAAVGKLCWDRFVLPLQDRLAQISAEQAALSHVWTGLSFPGGPAEPGRAPAQPVGGSSDTLFTSRYPGDAIFYGKLGDRNVLLTANRDTFLQRGVVNLVVRVFEPATLMRPTRDLRGPEIFPLFTYQNSFTIDPVQRSTSEDSTLVLTGNADGQPFRFELSVPGSGRSWIVEDRLPGTTLPAAR